MAKLLKDCYNERSLAGLAARFQAAEPAFPAGAFVRGVLEGAWAELGLKARVRKVTRQLGKCLPADYAQALAVLDRVLAGYPAGTGDLALLCFPDFVEVYGQEPAHWELSMAALARYTPYASAEFAVRPFLLRDQERMMAQMAVWAGWDDAHVRRLASEGCRPRLPWGQALPGFQKDPSPVLALLERLKADPSPDVRKSVANNLNDISKTHPGLVLETAKRWYGSSRDTDWIVKHGCRTLLKQGSAEALALFGLAGAGLVAVDGFALASPLVAIGGTLAFSFRIAARQATRVRLEYGVDYVKANGGRRRKIFQLSELSLKENERRDYSRTHSFADISTRRHYPGVHALTLIVNGAARGTLEFEVVRAE